MKYIWKFPLSFLQGIKKVKMTYIRLAEWNESKVHFIFDVWITGFELL